MFDCKSNYVEKVTATNYNAKILSENEKFTDGKKHTETHINAAI